jgi:hypothetical protein
MAVGRTYSKSRLKEMLNTRMAEYQMLNKTLIEMIEKGSSEANIDLLKNDIAEKQEAIDTLKDWIQQKVEQEADKKDIKEGEKASMYDSIKKKPRLTKSVKMGVSNNLYDSIKKETNEPSKDKEYGEDFAPYDSPYNHLNYEDIYNAGFVAPKNILCEDFPPKDQYGDVTYTNGFLVRFGTPFGIPEWYVRRVSFFSSRGKELEISVFDFIDSNTNRPIIADILGMINNAHVAPFNISIDHFGSTGNLLYTERYHGCKIKEARRSDLYYENDDISTIDMLITYSDVSYETAN